MQRIFKSFAAVAVTAAVFAPAAHANLIQNGSFENYNLGNACKNSASIGCVNVGAGATLASGQWAILGSPSGNTGTLADWNTGTLGVELRNNVAGSAFDGNIFVELDTTANSLVYQNIGTTLGTHYLLSFAYQPRPGVTNASNPIRVTWNGSTVNAFSSIISEIGRAHV